VTLDLKDRKILFALEQNARQTNVTLAQEVGLAPDVVQYRIDRLVNRGVLKFFLGYINFAKLGYVDYGLNMSTQRMTRKQEQSFVEFFSKHPYCPYFCRSGGTYDYVADILARDPLSLMESVTEITNKFGDFIYRQEIVTRIHATHFAKQYLMDAAVPPKPSTYFGGKLDERAKIDETDDMILRILATNARAKLVDLAQQIDLSDTAIGQRVKRMEEDGLITGYFAWIEPQQFGYQSFNLLLKHQSFRAADEEELFEFCRVHRHVTWLIKTLGPWDFEVAVEVKDQEELQDVVYELKDRFARIIQRIEFAPIFRTIKYSQYPFSTKVKAWL
jgi:Lrp/AsnC family leucine-responsive transcriptional regulator